MHDAMPCYYFDIRDGVDQHWDDEGLDLPDLAAARREAMRTLVEMARGVLPDDGERHTLTIDVQDGAGRLVFTATLSLVVGH